MAAISPTNADARFRISRRCVRLCKLQLERDTIFLSPHGRWRSRRGLSNEALVRLLAPARRRRHVTTETTAATVRNCARDAHALAGPEARPAHAKRPPVLSSMARS